MSETPRNDESPEYRDPTAPSDPTEQVPTSGDTQQLPSAPEPGTPSAPAVPPAPPAPGSPESPSAPQAPGYGPPPGYAPPPGYGPPPGSGPPPGGAPAAPQNPYAAPSSQAQNPYGAPPPPPQYPTQDQVQAGGYGPGYAAPPVQYSQPRSMSGNTIALLVVSGLATFGCLFGMPALVFAIIAATKTHEPEAQAKYTRYGWIAFGVTLVLVIVAVVALIALAATSGSTYDSTY